MFVIKSEDFSGKITCSYPAEEAEAIKIMKDSIKENPSRYYWLEPAECLVMDLVEYKKSRQIVKVIV